MQEIIQAIKDIFGAAISLGWQPIPTVIASAMMLVARSIWEPAILDVMTKDDLARMGNIKLKIFGAVFIGSFIIHIGISKPANSWDWCTALGFCIGHTMFAYVISSSAKMKSLIKGAINATPQPQPPASNPPAV